MMSDIPKTPPTLAKLQEQRDLILAIAEKYHAYNVRVFGSVARGNSIPGSDVDFLVNFRENASLLDVSGLRLDLMDLLGCSVDIVSDHPGLKPRFRKHVTKDLKPL